MILLERTRESFLGGMERLPFLGLEVSLEGLGRGLGAVVMGTKMMGRRSERR